MRLSMVLRKDLKELISVLRIVKAEPKIAMVEIHNPMIKCIMYDKFNIYLYKFAFLIFIYDLYSLYSTLDTLPNMTS